MSIRTAATLFLSLGCLFANVGMANNDDAKSGKAKADAAAADQDRDETTAASKPLPPFQLDKETKKVLQPLLDSIKNADVSRTTIELSAETIVNGAVIDTQKSTYQIASRAPGKFTIYLKEPEQRTRIFCNGEDLVVAVAPDAYYKESEPISLQDAVFQLPLVMGPYPEPAMALSLASVDPAASLLAGMKSVEVADRNKFRGEQDAVHLRGVQDDEVTWDLWLSDQDPPKPLRMLIDITPVIVATNNVQVPEGFAYQLRFDFLTWRMTGSVDDKLFTYTPPKGATEYESLQDYYTSIAGVIDEHPLLGKAAPNFAAQQLDGKEFSSDALVKKVVVMDFWATWCAPCAVSLPIAKEVCAKFADEGVVFLAVNTGEKSGHVKGFLSEQKWRLPVLIDEKGKVADGFQIASLPMTVVIGQTGMIESVHIGFSGPEAYRERLTEELEVLVQGGKIGSADTQ